MKVLSGLRDPDHLSQLDLGAALNDMGLGKTMQVLALLLILRKAGEAGGAGHESPASKAACSGGGPRD
jgi:SNF2 family DNA or RNA helicase